MTENAEAVEPSGRARDSRWHFDFHFHGVFYQEEWIAKARCTGMPHTRLVNRMVKIALYCKF